MAVSMDGEGKGLPKTEQQKAAERRAQAEAGAGTGTPSYGSVTPSAVNGTGSGSEYLAAAQKNLPQESTNTGQNPNLNYYDWSNLPVYTGSRPQQSASYSGGIPGPTVDVDVTDAYKNQQAAFYGLDDKQRRMVMMAANAIGGYEVPASWYNGVYDDALKAAASSYAQGKKVTVWDVLKGWAGGKNTPGSDGSSGLRGSGSSGSGGGSFSATTRSVSLTNPGTAERILDAALTNFLGRQATKSELRIFTKQLNRAEAANPTVTTQAGYSAGGNTQSNVVSQGGVDAALQAEKYAESRPDYAEYQAATTYMDAFMNALSDPVNI